MYFREYVCRFSRKSHYFCILGVSHLNSLWLSDVIYRSGSTLPQVMACCLAAPSHYLNQCWLIISWVLLSLAKDQFWKIYMYLPGNSEFTEMVNISGAEFILENMIMYVNFLLLIDTQSAGSGNTSNRRTCLCCIFNMVADGLVMQGARASAVMVPT